MKKLLFVLLMSVGIANARGIAYFNNDAGGRIVLTDEICKDKDNKVYEGLYRIHMYTANGIFDEGCYYLDEQTVITVWRSGLERRYPTSNFIIIKKDANQGAPGKSNSNSML
jgi:hypothetical protein